MLIVCVCLCVCLFVHALVRAFVHVLVISSFFVRPFFSWCVRLSVRTLTCLIFFNILRSLIRSYIDSLLSSFFLSVQSSVSQYSKR